MGAWALLMHIPSRRRRNIPGITYSRPGTKAAAIAWGLSSRMKPKVVPERRHFSRNPKWGPSDFGCKQWGDGHCLRRPAFVLHPSRHALRAAPGLSQ